MRAGWVGPTAAVGVPLGVGAAHADKNIAAVSAPAANLLLYAVH